MISGIAVTALPPVLVRIDGPCSPQRPLPGTGGFTHPAGRGDPVDQPVRLDLLRLALRLDQAVTAEAVEDLVEVADVQPAPLVADGLLEAGLELVAVGWLGRQQGQYRVVQGHAPYLAAR
jgi:hypothetical protein